MSGLQKPIELFCSYAHEDESLLQKLETHLSMLKRQGLISTWYDRQITAGTQWARVIDAHLNSASVILLLISPDFFASDYCYGIEMTRALARHEANEARVISILLRPVDWKGAPFVHLQALPTNAKPITTWSNRDEAFADVVTGIRRAIEDLAQLSASDVYGEKPVSEPQGAGKYQINIHGPISGLTIGDHNQVTSNFGNTLGHPTAPEQVGSPKGVLPQVSFGEPFPKIWNVTRRHTSFFTGRDHALEQIADGFRLKNKAGMVPYQALSGSAGIGKTQTAAEYAYRSRGNYDAVFWVRAETQEDLIADFRAVAGQLQLPEKDSPDQMMGKAVQKWLRTSTQWLLILDNADNLPLIVSFLPEAATGHLLLTTRARATIQLADPLILNSLEAEDGALFILRRAGYLKWNEQLGNASAVSAKAAQELSRLMEGLPLALEQAGAYIEDTGCGVRRYLDLYQDFRPRLHHIHSGAVPDYPEPVACAWKISWSLVERRSHAAADLLRLCAFLAPETIAEEIVTRGVSVLDSPLGSVAANPIDLNDAIDLLRRSSLLQREVDHETDLPRLSIHRVIQQVLQDEMDPPTQRLWAERAVRAVAQALPIVEWQVIQAHVRQCVQLIKRWDLTFREAKEILHYLKGRQN